MRAALPPLQQRHQAEGQRGQLRPLTHGGHPGEGRSARSKGQRRGQGEGRVDRGGACGGGGVRGGSGHVHLEGAVGHQTTKVGGRRERLAQAVAAVAMAPVAAVAVAVAATERPAPQAAAAAARGRLQRLPAAAAAAAAKGHLVQGRRQTGHAAQCSGELRWQARR